MTPIFDMLRAVLRGQVLAKEPLSRHTTWRVGGPAEIFIVPADREDLLAALALLHRHQVSWLPIGAGSNLLACDGGVAGAVVQLGRLRRLTFARDGTVRAEAGVALMTLIREAAQRGLAGLEGLSGIPGTLGGGICMNAGADGQDLAGVVREVTLAGGSGVEVWAAERLRFGYRSSAIGTGRVVVDALLALHPSDPEQLAEKIRTRLAGRRQAQGVGAPSAGSVFKNPPGHQAWQLIDQAGLRGLRRGGARVSEKHANFIVNAGGATARDILGLIGLVQRKVAEKTGIVLEPEVRIVGED